MVRALPIGEEATYDHSTVPMTTADDLFAAIDAGQPDRVRSILDADASLAAARDGDGVSAVMHALYHGQREVAEIVAGRLPALDVFEAAGLARADEVARLVAGDPSLAGAWSADGFTALHFAAFFGGGGAAAALLAAGADPNLRSRNELEVMPIHSAVAGGHRDVVIALLDAGRGPERPPAPRLDAAPGRGAERRRRAGRPAARRRRRSWRPPTTRAPRPPTWPGRRVTRRSRSGSMPWSRPGRDWESGICRSTTRIGVVRATNLTGSPECWPEPGPGRAFAEETVTVSPAAAASASTRARREGRPPPRSDRPGGGGFARPSLLTHLARARARLHRRRR